jgi:xanthine dehydrogenase accessory factor
MRVLLFVPNAGALAAFGAAIAALSRRQRGGLITCLGAADAAEVDVRFVAGDAVPADLEEVWRRALRSEEPALVEEPATGATLLLEPLLPAPRLLIVGGGHVGQAVARLASMAGFAVTVLDDRPEFAAPALFPPGTHTRCGEMAREVGQFDFAPDLYAVIVTRGHQHDAAVLERCLRRPAAYVGMIGSARKVALLRKDFLAAGKATAEEFDRVYAPIGLDLGAVTVPEIAVSVVAQLIAVRRRGSAGRMPGEPRP